MSVYSLCLYLVFIYNYIFTLTVFCLINNSLYRQKSNIAYIYIYMLCLYNFIGLPFSPTFFIKIQIFNNLTEYYGCTYLFIFLVNFITLVYYCKFFRFINSRYTGFVKIYNDIFESHRIFITYITFNLVWIPFHTKIYLTVSIIF